MIEGSLIVDSVDLIMCVLLSRMKWRRNYQSIMGCSSRYLVA